MSFYSDFAEHYEIVFPFREEVHAFLERHLPAGNGRLLDVGCGTGHYCGRLAAEGAEAVGIDSDPAMIARARRNYPGAEFRVMDMAAIARVDGPFAGAYCIGNVLSHLDRAALARFVADLAELLCPGAVWVVQTVNWDRILEQDSFQFPDRAIGDGALVFRRRYEGITPARARFVTRLKRGDTTVFAGDVWLHPLPAADCIRVHQERGFRLRARFGDYREEPFGPGSSPACVCVFAR